MKTDPLIPWWFLLVAAFLNVSLAALYEALEFPKAITLYPAGSACLLICCALLVKRQQIPSSPFEYGRCNGSLARRHKITGEVQFILWRAGEQGHKENIWHRFDPSWWPNFTPSSSLSAATNPESSRSPGARLESARTS